MKFLRIIALITLLISYGLLVYYFFIDATNQENRLLFNLVWIIGLISFFSNIVYAIKVMVSDHLLSSLGFSGLIWRYPLWTTYRIGLTSLLFFLVAALYVLLKPTAIKS